MYNMFVILDIIEYMHNVCIAHTLPMNIKYKTNY